MDYQFEPTRVETKAGHMYIIPAGTVVANGGTPITVSKNVWPDAVPTDNYADYELKEINSIKPNFEKDSEQREYASSTDGYTKSKDEWITERSWTVETDMTNALIIMLEEGLTALPVVGTAATPGARKESYVEAVVLMEIGTRGIGITKRRWIWARVYLESPGDSTSKISKISLRVAMQEADNNSFEQVA
ncbi:MAG: hypothetical protein ABIT37_05840 [Luteolibacter sp.]